MSIKDNGSSLNVHIESKLLRIVYNCHNFTKRTCCGWFEIFTTINILEYSWGRRRR